MTSLVSLAHSIGLEVLMEIHSEKELTDHLNSAADLIGVNNRDLRTFKVDVEVSKKLASKIPDGVAKISESGISSPDTVIDLMHYGYTGFLLGESFMKHSQPGEACKALIGELRKQRELKRTDP
jgi:indole-3-glycerol phosphate synthase